jgi:small basic protein
MFSILQFAEQNLSNEVYGVNSFLQNWQVFVFGLRLFFNESNLLRHFLEQQVLFLVNAVNGLKHTLHNT